MARHVSGTPLSARPITPRRRRRGLNRVRTTTTSCAAASTADETQQHAGPTLRWVLIPDAAGRIRPRAEWH
ncbi:hypothetical protein [Salinactinospora qingdaonensis]|uniref:Uncharacterized protein n=1 Tax=Salinactinospora qingdaonensis TaxID=702744 RepID=A0ABP7FCQ3_9ACTN